MGPADPLPRPLAKVPSGRSCGPPEMGPQDPNLGPPRGPKRGVPGGPKSGFSGVLGGSWGDPPRPPENAEKMALFWGLRCENEGGGAPPTTLILLRNQRPVDLVDPPRAHPRRRPV